MRPHPLIRRDISSANVLLEPLPNDQWRAKVSDYGTVNLLENLATIGPGNPCYAAPEANDPTQHGSRLPKLRHSTHEAQNYHHNESPRWCSSMVMISLALGLSCLLSFKHLWMRSSNGSWRMLHMYIRRSHSSIAGNSPAQLWRIIITVLNADCSYSPDNISMRRTPKLKMSILGDCWQIGNFMCKICHGFCSACAHGCQLSFRIVITRRPPARHIGVNQP